MNASDQAKAILEGAARSNDCRVVAEAYLELHRLMVGGPTSGLRRALNEHAIMLRTLTDAQRRCREERDRRMAAEQHLEALLAKLPRCKSGFLDTGSGVPKGCTRIATKIAEDYRHDVGVCDECHVAIEQISKTTPFLHAHGDLAGAAETRAAMKYLAAQAEAPISARGLVRTEAS